MTRFLTMALVLMATFTALSFPVYADAIDGHWCHKDGRRMSIEGPNIVTPGGTSMEGDYDRHGFIYVAPAGERHAGSRISMAMQSEDIISMFISGKGAGKEPGPNQTITEEWQRCHLTM